MSTILLVEDNEHIMRINSAVLRHYGHEVLKAYTAAECRKILTWQQVDLVVLDVMLPDGNGLELCRELKSSCNVPVLFLSALGDSKDVVEGLRAGGDDYLAKPYDLEELEARIEARLRQDRLRGRYLSFGALKLDTVTGCGYLDSVNVQLTQKEFSVLRLLVESGGRTVTTEELVREAWGQDTESNRKALWTLISRLRGKLNSEKSRMEISSKRRDGYKLELI